MKNKMIYISATSIIRKKPILIILLFVAIIASTLLQVTPAFIIRQIVDNHFIKGVYEGIWNLAFLYLIVVSAGNLFEFLKVSMTTMMGQSILMEIRTKMAERLTFLPIQYFVKTPTGEIMSKLTTDVDAINHLFSAGIINVITDMFKMFGLLVSLYIIAPQLIWLQLIIIPAVYFLSNHYRKKIFSFQKTVRMRIASIYIFIQEWIMGLKTVKAYSAEKHGKYKFQILLQDLLMSINKVSAYDSWFPCLMYLFRSLVIALTLWLSIDNQTLLSLNLSIGTLAAAIDLTGKLFAPLEAFATEFQTIQQSMAGISRVNDFFNETPETRNFKPQTLNEDGIKIENVTFSYDTLPVLDNLSLHIKKGEKAVLIGRSGSGKTTLMNIVSGLIEPQKGAVLICGVNPFEMFPQARRKLIGIVPQMPQIFDGTIAENISLLDKNITLEQIKNAAKTVQIHELIESLPYGYDTLIGEGEYGLSSGEIQLLSIARAIVADPKVLLLDEPTSGIDVHTEKKILSAIRAISEGRTILSISHRLSGILDAETVHIVHNNRIVESGSPAELSALDGWYSMYSKIESSGWKVSNR